MGAGSDAVEIEWLERGWPLRSDGRCDTTMACEQGLFAMSWGLAGMNRDFIDRVFGARGGAWNAQDLHFDDRTWLPGFPGNLVLKRDRRLHAVLGRDLVLGLIERRHEPGDRPFTRCLWFILPSEWSHELDLEKLAAACELLLRHRGRPMLETEAAPLVLERRPSPVSLPTLTRVGDFMVARNPATPIELMVALADYQAREGGRGRKAAWLDEGLAVFCAASAARQFSLAIPAEASQLCIDWRAPIPFLGAAEGPGSLDGGVGDEGPVAPVGGDLGVGGSPARRSSARKVSRPRIKSIFRILVVLLVVQLVQITLMGIAILGPFVASLAAKTHFSLPEPQEPRPRLRAVTRKDGLAGLILPGSEIDRDDRRLSRSDRALLAALTAPEAPLAVVGFASDDDCEEADELARSMATRGARLLHAEGRGAEIIVVGRRGLLPIPLPPDFAASAGALVVDGEDAESWRDLAATECAP